VGDVEGSDFYLWRRPFGDRHDGVSDGLLLDKSIGESGYVDGVRMHGLSEPVDKRYAKWNPSLTWPAYAAFD
jgi:hypothetical protein